MIVKPTELQPKTTIKALIYGQPGIGKSTLALSMPAPILFDFDSGIRRIDVRHRVPSIQSTTSYSDIIKLLSDPTNFEDYDTIVVDTFGKLIDAIIFYISTKYPKYVHNSKPTQQGWGEVKYEVSNFVKMIDRLEKSVIFLAHESEEKDGETTKKRPDGSGKSIKDLQKELDLMGYFSMAGDKAVIQFKPNESFYAKNSLGIVDAMEVKKPESTNDWLDKNILQRFISQQNNATDLCKKYNDLISTIQSDIEKINSVSELNSYFSEKCGKREKFLSSDLVEKKLLHTKSKALNSTFNKDKNLFEGEIKQEEPKKPEPQEQKLI